MASLVQDSEPFVVLQRLDVVATDANLRHDAGQALGRLMRWQVPGEQTPLKLVPAAAGVLAGVVAPADDLAADVAAALPVPAKAQHGAFSTPS